MWECSACQRDGLGASYLAGLAAGGEAVDWVGWYLERIPAWTNEQIATARRAQVKDAAYRAELEEFARVRCAPWGGANRAPAQ